MRPGTYSIVARDPQTGDLGVAAQSHWFAIGAALPWAEPGVGAVATQSLPEPSSGRKALALLRDGLDPGAVLENLHADDPGVDVRQIGLVDATGRAAAHTGASCVREAGDRVGDGFACQASMMISPAVPDAMAAAFESATGTLDERLLARCLHRRIVMVQAVLLTIRNRAMRRRLSTRARTTTTARTPAANHAHGNDPPDAVGGDSGRPAATRVAFSPGPATNQPPWV